MKYLCTGNLANFGDPQSSLVSECPEISAYISIVSPYIKNLCPKEPMSHLGLPPKFKKLETKTDYLEFHPLHFMIYGMMRQQIHANFINLWQQQPWNINIVKLLRSTFYFAFGLNFRHSLLIS